MGRIAHFKIAPLTTPRTTAFIPALSPPEVSTAILILSDEILDPRTGVFVLALLAMTVDALLLRMGDLRWYR